MHTSISEMTTDDHNHIALLLNQRRPAMSKEVHRRIDALEGVIRRLRKELEQTAERGKVMTKSVVRVGTALAELIEHGDDAKAEALDVLEDIGILERTDEGEGIILWDKLDEIRKAFDLSTKKDPPAVPVGE